MSPNTLQVRPGRDEEYEAQISAGRLAILSTVTADDLAEIRRAFTSPPLGELVGDRPIRYSSHIVPSSGQAVSVLQPADSDPVAGYVIAIHGGGFLFGDRHSGIEFTFDWIEQLHVAVITPDYRLAPEFPYPAALEDCEAAWAWAERWIAQHAGAELPSILYGVSAGGCLAAALVLHRAEAGRLPKSLRLLLQAPMLDHRAATASARQFEATGQWDGISNRFGWSAYLALTPADDITPVMSPGLAEDLYGFPPTFIEVGSAEVFRDEDVAFASRLWACGVDAQLMVWPGGIHGFDRIAPHTQLAIRARQSRQDWLARALEQGVT